MLKKTVNFDSNIIFGSENGHGDAYGHGDGDGSGFGCGDGLGYGFFGDGYGDGG